MNPRPSETLLSLVRRQRGRYLVAIAAMLAAHSALLCVPLVPQAAIDGALEGDALAGTGPNWLTELSARLGAGSDVGSILWTAAGLLLLLTTIGGLFQYVRGRVAARAAERIVRGLRARLYDKLHRLSCAWHDGADTGDLVQRCTSDVDTLRAFLSVQVVQIAEAGLMLAILAPVLFALDTRMALVALALLPVILAFAVLFFRRIQRVFREVDEAEGRMTTVLQENLTGIRVVRAFARGDHERAKFGARNADYRDRLERMIHLLGNYWSLSDLVCFLQLGAVLFFGAHFVRAGELSVGTWFAFMTYEAMVLWPVRQLGRVLAETGKALVSISRLGEVLGVPAEGEHERQAERANRDAGELELFPAPAALRGGIELEGVTFAYEGAEPALRDLSLSIAPGETIALLGPPGSGKSTLVALLLRLYDYQTGVIRLDGRPLTTLDRGAVRRQIGVVLQEPFLYSKTIAQNLLVGRAGAATEELERAAAEAAVHESIQSFDDGYATLVGERGVTLSGGQRQRVALARALLKDPPILVLDDALSAVDTDTEARILGALRRRSGTRTTILIAHRLSTLQHADRVFVFERGAIVQSGRHDELVHVPGPYRRLWHLQGALEQELEHDLLTADAQPSDAQPSDAQPTEGQPTRAQTEGSAP